MTLHDTSGLTPAKSYPVNIEVAVDSRIARWRALIQVFMVVPASLWLAIVSFGATVVVVLSWFAILFTGRMPQRWCDYLAAVHRYRTRVAAYQLLLTATYPGFRLTAGAVDPGDHPVVWYGVAPASRSRGRVFFRVLLALPHAIVLVFVFLAMYVVAFVAWLSVLILGRWPNGLATFAVAVGRWAARYDAYVHLLVDEYPPFSLAGSRLQPGPLSTVADPSAGPLWPRLIADEAYVAPKLARWPIVVGAIGLVAYMVGYSIFIVHLVKDARPYDVSSSAAHFSATFPNKPRVGTVSGRGISGVEYVSTRPDDRLDVVAMTLDPGVTYDDRAAADAIAAGEGGTVTGSGTSSLGGQPASSFMFSNAAGPGEIRVLVVGNHVFVAVATGSSESAYSADLARFSDTFVAGP